MNELECKIAARIRQQGPIGFAAFMEMALYAPGHGYYRRDVFGRRGDFYTASQLQPVFGAVVRALAQKWAPGFERVVDLGAGRGEVGEAFEAGRYIAIEHGQNIPKTNHGVLFSNELIDAMPVALWQSGYELGVDLNPSGDGFQWHPHAPREGVVELRGGVMAHLEEAYASLNRGVYIVVDYGYKGSERLRFPTGTLMSYRRHAASEDVLREAGERDITAHVDWDALEQQAAAAGWISHGVQRLGAMLLDLGPEVLEGLILLGEKQMKALLFDFGESFDAVVLEKK